MSFLSIKPSASALIDNVKRTRSDVVSNAARLSSGSRLVRAGDDVAALSVAVRLQSQNAALKSAGANALQLSSLLEVAQGGLRNISAMLERMQAISVAAASPALSSAERHFYQIELDQLKQESERIAQQTQFNGIPVIAGSYVIPAANPSAGAGNVMLGTINAETLEGGALDDNLRALDGNDYVMAAAGNDRILSGIARMPGLLGRLYTSGGAINNITQAEAIITAAAGTPTASFHASALDYPQGAPNVNTSTIGAFLGADAGSLSNPALAGVAMNQMVVEFEGQINVPSDGMYSFSVGSDDGFRLYIDDVNVLQFPGVRGFSTTTGSVTLSEGMHDIRFIFFENAGQEGVRMSSALTGGGVVDGTVLSYEVSAFDGNDTVNGGDGYDTVVVDGTRSDYTLTPLSNEAYQLTDNREGSPTGDDLLINVERIAFADEELELVPSNGQLEDEVVDSLSFMISDQTTQTIEYSIVNATNAALFDEHTLSLGSISGAQESFSVIKEGLSRVTAHQATVGSLAAQADSVYEAISSRLITQREAYSVLADADIPSAATEYAKATLSADVTVNTQARHTELKRNILQRVFDSIRTTGQ